MKVVVNKCQGGFSISAAALKELVIRNASCVASITPKRYYGGEGGVGWAPRKDWETIWNGELSSYTDAGDGFQKDKNNTNLYKDGLLYMLVANDSVRTDSNLVDVVETMGAASFGSGAQLEVDTIAGPGWYVDEVGGLETLHNVA